jgi:chemotaxis protein CheX
MKTANQTIGATADHKTWIPLLELAAKEVFELMLASQLTVQESAQENTPEITAMVGLAGQLCGVMSIRCGMKAATLMASKMLGAEPGGDGAELRDAFGEVCNMVAGNFKNKVSGLGDGCMLSVPTVITGNDYSLHSLADSGGIEMAMLFEEMPMQISLAIHS